MSVNVAIVGVGLVGKAVIKQLASAPLSPIFQITSLTNSKHTLFLAPTAKPLNASEIIALLPASSGPAPSTPSIPEASYAPANPSVLVNKLVDDFKTSKKPTILVDCTSDLAITELYPLAIRGGISVVTPNKKGFSSSAKLWDAIQEAQAAPGAGLVYLESTVGAGLPIISSVKDLVYTGDEVLKVEGVLSGTLSYIFNEFSKADGSPAPKFSEVVKIAKENGYTEPHPADDLSGSDVARKLTILTRLISSSPFPSSLAALPPLSEGFASLPTDTLIPSALQTIKTGEEFVSRLPEFDDYYGKLNEEARKEGKVLRYVGLIDRKAGVVKCGLEKYDATHAFATSLKGSDNILSFTTERYKAPLIIQGGGAGDDLTAYGVVGDCIKAAERVAGVRIGGKL